MRTFLALFNEYLLILRNKLGYVFIKQPPLSWKEKGSKNILLLPGFNETWHTYNYLAPTLVKAGYRVHVPEYNSRASIIQCAEVVSDYILEHDLTDVYLVGHSKGGHIGKYVLDNFMEDERLEKLITVATPWQGSIFGYLYLFSLKELIPGSKTMSELAKDYRNNHKVYNFYSKIDNHVIPNSSLKLHGANNKQLNTSWHTLIMQSDELVEEVLKVLAN